MRARITGARLSALSTGTHYIERRRWPSRFTIGLVTTVVPPVRSRSAGRRGHGRAATSRRRAAATPRRSALHRDRQAATGAGHGRPGPGVGIEPRV